MILGSIWFIVAALFFAWLWFADRGEMRPEDLNELCRALAIVAAWPVTLPFVFCLRLWSWWVDEIKT